MTISRGLQLYTVSHTVGVKSMSPVDIELLFITLYSLTALHHDTNISSFEIK